MTAVDLVVTDLDGTLWELDHDLHPRTRAAVAELDRLGVPLLVATGRRQFRTAEPLARFGLAPPAVCLNGALGVHLATGERFHSATIPSADATAILAAFAAHGLQPCVYVDHPEVAVFVGPAPSTDARHLDSFGADVRTDDLARVVAEERVLAFSILGRPEEEVTPVAAAVGASGICHLGADRAYGRWAITVAGPAMSKWLGVLAYCDAHGVAADRILAVGDGQNDVELLAGAAVAVVTADAHPDARAVADHVVGLAADGGWADVLDLL